MIVQHKNSNAGQPAANAIPESLQIAIAFASAFSSHRDYGFDLSGYFGDDDVELVNCRVQGKF